MISAPGLANGIAAELEPYAVMAGCPGRLVTVEAGGVEVGGVVGGVVVDGGAVGVGLDPVAGARTSCWVTVTTAEAAVPRTLTTVSPDVAPAGTGRAAATRVQVEGLTNLAVPPLQERKLPELLNQDTVI
jgi:hypothetical protein